MGESKNEGNEGERNSLTENIRKMCGENTEETPETSDLHLTREEFMEKMLIEENGSDLLNLLEMGEWRACERMGLSKAYIEESQAYIDVPRWNNLVAHLKIVNSI